MTERSASPSGFAPRRHSGLSDPWRAPPPLCSNLVFRKRQLMRQENEASRRQQYGATGLQQRLLGNGHERIPSRRRLRRPLGRRQRPVAPRFPHTIPSASRQDAASELPGSSFADASGCRLPRRPARKPHAHPAQFAPVPRLASLPMRRSPSSQFADAYAATRDRRRLTDGRAGREPPRSSRQQGHFNFTGGLAEPGNGTRIC